LFRSEPGLKLKNAMTDNSGFKIGRFLIRDNYNRVLAPAAGPGLGQAEGLEPTQGLADDGAADPELGTQCRLGRQLVANLHSAVRNGGTELGEHSLHGAHSFDPLSCCPAV